MGLSRICNLNHRLRDCTLVHSGITSHHQLHPHVIAKGRFFGEMIGYNSINNTSCQISRRDHKIWTCPKFVEKSVSKRWDTAKRFNLRFRCFRCLGDGHRGKSCPRNLPCGENGCKKLHHVLLHRNDDRQVKANSKCYILNKSFPTKTCHNPAESRRIVTNNLHVHRGKNSK